MAYLWAVKRRGALNATVPLEQLVCQLVGARRARHVSHVQELWGGYGELAKFELEGARLQRVIVKYARPPAVVGRESRGKASESARSHKRKLRSYAVESCWYRDYAERCDDSCRVAASLGSVRRDGAWVFVLEDLDAAGFERRATQPSLREIHDVLHWLAAFHATFLGTKPEGLWKVGTYWHLATRPDELGRLRDPELRRLAGQLDARLSGARYLTLVHGDAKVENFCFSDVQRSGQDQGTPLCSMPRVAAVDFQYVGAGCGIKDVAYFFSSVWESDECLAQAADALDVYLEELRRELRARRPELDADAVAAEWQSLYPAAWADLQRFLLGWAPGYFEGHTYAGRMLRLATQP